MASTCFWWFLLILELLPLPYRVFWTKTESNAVLWRAYGVKLHFFLYKTSTKYIKHFSSMLNIYGFFFLIFWSSNEVVCKEGLPTFNVCFQNCSSLFNSKWSKELLNIYLDTHGKWCLLKRGAVTLHNLQCFLTDPV